MMKKSLLSLAGILLCSAVLWVVNAQADISELFYEWAPLKGDAYAQVLNNYGNSRWYSDSLVVTCDANNQIVISSPVVEDSYMDNVRIYNLFLSPYRMSQIKDNDSSVDISKILMKKSELWENDGEVKFEVSSSDVDANSIYYGFISPVDAYDEIWTPSKEICFQLSNNMCLQGSACDSIWVVSTPAWNTDNHGAASDCVWMDLANVTHVKNWNTITLKWTAVDWDVVQIAVFDPNEEIYKNLWAVNMSDEKFDYTMQWDGEQNFMLTNGCRDLYYKADAKRWPEPVVTPETGPAENVLYIAIAAIILYGAYTLFFRKSENN
jgi:hypothetical protein